MQEALINRFRPLTQEEIRNRDGLAPAAEAREEDPAAALAEHLPQADNQWITLRQHPRFVFFPPHRHDEAMITFLLAGHLAYTMEDGTRVELHPGDLLLINRCALHAAEKCGEEDIAVHLAVKPAFFDLMLEASDADNPLGRFFLSALKNGDSSVPFLYYPTSGDPAVQCLMESVIYGFLNGTSGERMRGAEMQLLFLHLLGMDERFRGAETPYSCNPMVIELLHEIQTHYNDFCLTDFAKGKRVSPAYISRLMREATGKSCTELLQNRRLEKARQLLACTDQSVLCVCEKVGYCNSSYFYRLFENRFGVSPTAYRSSQRTQNR